MTMTSAPTARTTIARRNPRYFLISLWSIPVMVIGQFAFLAVIPVLVVLISSVRVEGLRAVRPWAIALGITYSAPLLLWLIRPNGAQSLSKDIHPAFVVLITLVAILVLIRTYSRR
jgi:hypothetical protein